MPLSDAPRCYLCGRTAARVGNSDAPQFLLCPKHTQKAWKLMNAEYRRGAHLATKTLAEPVECAPWAIFDGDEKTCGAIQKDDSTALFVDDDAAAMHVAACLGYFSPAFPEGC